MIFSIGKKDEGPQPSTDKTNKGDNSSVKQNNGEKSTEKNNNVKTGDNESMLIYSMILMGTLISALYVAKRKNA